MPSAGDLDHGAGRRAAGGDGGDDMLVEGIMVVITVEGFVFSVCDQIRVVLVDGSAAGGLRIVPNYRSLHG